MRFHVLGVGAIGTLISHHLRLTHPSTPISLIVRRARALRKATPSSAVTSAESEHHDPVSLSVERDGHTATSSNYDLEIWQPTSDHALRSALPIQSLVVTLKAPQTLKAVSALAHRLSPSSVITLLQNGMGTYDELCSALFPDPAKRPFFVLGTTTHGVSPTQVLGTVHHRSPAGMGDIKWVVMPDPRGEVDMEQWLWGRAVSRTPVLDPPPSPTPPFPQPPASSVGLDNVQHTLEALLRLPDLSPQLVPMPHLQVQLLHKLAMNSIINPLTAILGSGSLPNGALAQFAPADGLIRSLARETSDVLIAHLQHQYAPDFPPADLLAMFQPARLRQAVYALVKATSKNVSSMAMDVKMRRETENQYISGYIVELGKRLGVDTPRHRMLMGMVDFVSEAHGYDMARTGRTWVARRMRWRQEDAKRARAAQQGIVSGLLERQKGEGSQPPEK